MLMKYAPCGEFKNVYRPRAIEYVAGHSAIKNFLINSIEKKMLPQVMMFYGQRGVGKTTLSRIVAMGLNCEEGVSLSPCGVCDNCRSIFSGSNPDFREINVADKTGINDIREMSETFKFSPMYLDNKVYVLDECHMLSKQGQNAILKHLEDTPENVYIIFCTTSKENLIPTLLDRCYDFYFKDLTNDDLLGVANDIIDIEGEPLDKEIVQCIVDVSDGSVRNVVVNLQKILLANVRKISDVSDVLGTDMMLQYDIKQLSKAILDKNSREAFKIISKYSYTDCDIVRKSLINYFGTILLRAGKVNIKKATKLSDAITTLSTNINNPTKGLFINDIFKITTF